MGGGHDGWARPYTSGRRDLIDDGVGCVTTIVKVLVGFLFLACLVMFIMWLAGYGHLLKKDASSNANVQETRRD